MGMVDLGKAFAQEDPLHALAEQANLSVHELLENLGFGVVQPSAHMITRHNRYADILRGLIGYHKLVGKPEDEYDEYREALKYALMLVEREIEAQNGC